MPEGDEPTPDPQNPDAVTITLPPESTPPAGARRTPAPASEAKTYTEDQVEAIRLEEQQKVHSRLSRVDTLETELTELKKERDERAKAETKAQRDAEAVRKKAQEEEMSAKDLIAAKEKEWQDRFESERQERLKMEAVMQKERELAQLQMYIAQRMTTEGEEIIDHLRDLVGGNTREEIDASIESMKQRTAAIRGDVLAAQDMAAARQQQEMAGRRTVGVTAPPIGPTDMQGTTVALDPDAIKNMSMDDYAQIRQPLLAQVSQERSRRR